jgi:hypothetical protein
MMSDKQFAELELRATICPQQCRWPKPEYVHWQKLHEAANEARSRVSKFYALADEIDRNSGLSRDDKYRQRSKSADEAIADFEASKTLARAREARHRDVRLCGALLGAHRLSRRRHARVGIEGAREPCCPTSYSGLRSDSA